MPRKKYVKSAKRQKDAARIELIEKIAAINDIVERHLREMRRLLKWGRRLGYFS